MENGLWLSNSQQIQKFYQMTLLRKNTVPVSEPQKRRQQLRGKVCSQVNILQFSHHAPTSYKCSNQSGAQHGSNYDTILQPNTFTKEEVEKIVGRNGLTVNFNSRTDPATLPSIASFDKIKGLLIKRSLFERFKEYNKENGSYLQALAQLQKEEDFSTSKINIYSLNKLASLKNFEKDKKSLSLICDQREELKEHTIDKRIHRLSDHLQPQPLRLPSFKQPHKAEEKGRQLSEEEEMLKNRLKVLEKLQNITHACCTASQQYQIEKSINLFAKFTEKMDEQLLRKKKRLEKVFHFHL